MPRAAKFKASLAVCACILFALSVAGCSGGGVSITTTSVPNPAALDGNWLLVGQLPVVSSTQTGNNGFGIAMTFSVAGNQMAGGGSTQIPCPSWTAGGGIIVSGSVGSDGSFSAETSATQPSGLATLQIKGNVPSSDTNSWTGTYTFSNTDPTCPFSSSGPVTAVRIADLTGTYTASASLSPPPPSTGSSQPISLSFNLQQGVAGSGPAGSQSVDETFFTGTVAVQGTSCFSTGQIAESVPAVDASILGTKVIAIFTMDDGSLLSVTGGVEDTASSKLSFVGGLVSGGKCDNQLIGPFEASRQ